VGTATVTAVAGVATFTDVGLSGTAATYTLTFASGTLTSATQTVALGAGVASRFRITGSASQDAGVSQDITITALDDAGNTVTSYTGVKSLTFGGALASPGGTAPIAGGTAFGTATNITFASGQAATVPMTLYAAGSATISARDEADPAAPVVANGADRLAVTVSAGTLSATGSTLQLSRTTMPVNDTITVAVTLRDAYGNAATAATSANFAVGALARGTIGTFTCSAGVCTAKYTSGAVAPETVTIGVTIGGVNISGSPAEVSIVAPGRYMVTSVQTTLAVNEVSERMEFRIRDGSASSPVTQATVFNLTSSSGTGTFYSDVNGNSSITQVTVAAGDSIVRFFYRQTAGAGTTSTITVTRASGDAVVTATANVGIVAVTAASSRLDREVCSATTGNSGNASSLTSDTACTAAAGELLLMVFGHDVPNTHVLPSFTPPVGWTLQQQEAAGTGANQLGVYVYYRIATGAGDYKATFTTTGGEKVRMTYTMLAVKNPNAGTPIEASAANKGIPSDNFMPMPSVTAGQNSSALIGYAVQNIGSNNFVAPAGLSRVTVAGQGGQAITMILFSKDRVFSGPTPEYRVRTDKKDNAFVAGTLLFPPQ
jgi:hypothetical protein